jgi:hypothetical protein
MRRVRNVVIAVCLVFPAAATGYAAWTGSAASPTLTTTSAGPYLNPTGVSAPVFVTCLGAGNAEIKIASFTIPGGTAGNVLRMLRATASGGPYTVVQTASLPTSPPIFDTGLANNTTYYYELQIADDGSSAWAGAATVPQSVSLGTVC